MKFTLAVAISSILSAAMLQTLQRAFQDSEVHKRVASTAVSEFSCPKSRNLCVPANTHKNARFKVAISRWSAAANIAQERFQVGPISLEFRMRTTEPEQFDDQSEDTAWLISGVGINSNLSASLDLFSIRVMIELNLLERPFPAPD